MFTQARRFFAFVCFVICTCSLDHVGARLLLSAAQYQGLRYWCDGRSEGYINKADWVKWRGASDPPAANLDQMEARSQAYEHEWLRLPRHKPSQSSYKPSCSVNENQALSAGAHVVADNLETVGKGVTKVVKYFTK